MSLLLGAALFATAIVLFVLQPILTGRRAPMSRGEDEMSDTEARRRVTLLALRDVEYDRVTGKLDEHDYRELHRELSGEALAALAAEREERAAEEAAGAFPSTVASTGIIDLEAEIQRVRHGLRAGTTCGVCGHVNPRDSRFCSSCGERLSPRAGDPPFAAEDRPSA
jgi:cytochrome c-type biogenesis protein CcmI